MPRVADGADNNKILRFQQLSYWILVITDSVAEHLRSGAVLLQLKCGSGVFAFGVSAARVQASKRKQVTVINQRIGKRITLSKHP